MVIYLARKAVTKIGTNCFLLVVNLYLLCERYHDVFPNLKINIYHSYKLRYVIDTRGDLRDVHRNYFLFLRNSERRFRLIQS